MVNLTHNKDFVGVNLPGTAIVIIIIIIVVIIFLLRSFKNLRGYLFSILCYHWLV